MPQVAIFGVMPELTPLLTLRDVAACLRLHQRTVYDMARGGRLPGAVFLPPALATGRGQWRVNPAKFQRWLDERQSAVSAA